MGSAVTKTEYQSLKNEMKNLEKKVDLLETIIKGAQRRREEDEILAIAKEAEELTKKGRLPVLESLKELR